MFNTNSGLSLSDIAAVTRDNDGFAGGNGWWVLIILLALFGGWGNAGYGFAGGNAGAADNYVLASDFATVQRQIDSASSEIRQGINALGNGISSLGYDQLSQMNGINSNIVTAQNNLNAGITNLGYQLQQCCCDNKSAIADLKYGQATNTCSITTAINNAAQQIIQNDNANYRQLHDENIAIQMEAKNDKIATLTAQLNRADLAASQAAQNEYLISKLRDNCNCCGC